MLTHAHAPGAADGAGPWLASLALLYPVPAPHRAPQTGRREALEILRCGPAVLDELLRAGLPHSRGSEGELFDRHDLINLALNSGTGQSAPERAMRFALRWMHEDPKTWTLALDWTLRIELACADPGGCGADASFSHARLMPERNGGALEQWRSEPPQTHDGELMRFAGPGPVVFSGLLRTEGELLEIKSPRLRRITRDFIDADYRWARLPKAVQADYRTVMAAGYAPCVTASLFLAQQYEAAGYRASTRSGWILGMLDLAHSWVEVLDDDGVVKTVDAVFGRLSRHSAAPHPALPRAVLGSRINRVLPAGAGAGDPLARHRCGGRDSAPTIRTLIRRVGER